MKFENIYNHVYGEPLPEQDFYAVLSTGYKRVELNGRLNAYNGIDTDGDTVSDWDEVHNELLTIDTTGQYVLPTVMECAKQLGEIPFYVTDSINGSEAISRYMSYKVLPIVSDPSSIDGDCDGYNDEQDLAPLVPFVNPIILLHGRTDSSAGAFGLHTNVCPYNEDKKNDSIDFYDDKSDYYSNVMTHIIDANSINSEKLGYYLSQHNYEINKNLFAFSYPNWDFAQNNASKLACYIHNLKRCVKGDISRPKYFMAKNSDIFATKNDLKNNHARFILIGHSNGGLVSRYYIENMDGDKNVDKLITIDTPHYGSIMAYFSTIAMQAGYTLGIAVPLDVELRPNSSLFTGEKLDTNSIKTTLLSMGGTFALGVVTVFIKLFFTESDSRERLQYIQSNQSPQLMGNSNVKTLYYSIGGCVAYYEGAPFVDMVYNAEFSLDSSSLDAFKTGINDAIKDEYSAEVKRIPPLSGDNVVELYSQFGLKVDGNAITEHVEFEKTTIFFAFKPLYDLYTVFNNFHGDILNNRQMHSTVLKYIED